MAAHHPGSWKEVADGRGAGSRRLLTGRVAGRFSVRLVAGLLGVSIPVMVVLTAVLSHSASSSLGDANAAAVRAAAASGALRVDYWIGDREASVSTAALA